jgi:hypothetical protein
MTPQSRLIYGLTAALALVPLVFAASGADQPASTVTRVNAPPSAWSTSASLSVKETYDSNVYLQDVAPTNSVAGAMPAKKGSFVTTVSPRLTVDYKPCSAFKASLSYTPDFAWYESAHSEDNMTHRWGANFGGAIDKAVWDLQNNFTYIDGSKKGPIFGRPGDCPAIGGIPLRDRREAFIYKSGFRVAQTFDKWMIRPVASAYVHDFKTDLRTSPAGGVYENYIDRQDINGGLDVGFEVVKKMSLVLGYRHGRQDQFKTVTSAGALTNSPYANTYNRILVGVEGAPVTWLKLAVLAGPDIRQFDHRIVGFDRNELLYYVDASINVLPTKQDSITLSNKRYEQPAFSSFSMYEDIIYELSWKHKFDDHWSGSAGFKLYIGDWQAPVNREDWIYTPSAGLSYTHDKHLSAELAWSYDWVENQIPTTAAGASFADGREFTRHLVSLAVKYAF